MYIGNGEWEQTEEMETGAVRESTPRLIQEQQWIRKWMIDHDEDNKLHHQVRKKGYPNRWGAKIEVKSTWNVTLMEELLQDYEDKEVVEWLKFGWPTGRIQQLPPPVTTRKNHKGATEHPEHLKRYIEKEASYGAVMGPYDKIPFAGNIGISPLSTRPKKGSQERREPQ